MATIQTWKQEDAPLDDMEKMRAYIAKKDVYAPRPMGAGRDSLDAIKISKGDIEIQLLQLKLDTELGSYIEIDKVRESGVKIATSLDASLKVLEGELPSTLAGLSEKDIQKELHTHFLKLRESLKKDLSQYE